MTDTKRANMKFKNALEKKAEQMKAKIHYSITEVGSTEHWRNIPCFLDLTSEQKQELQEKGMLTVKDEKRVTTISAMEFKKHNEEMNGAK